MKHNCRRRKHTNICLYCGKALKPIKKGYKPVTDLCKGKTNKGDKCNKQALIGGYCIHHWNKKIDAINKKMSQKNDNATK